MQELIGGLPIELRETLVLRELEELSYKDIAEVTQTPIGTVMSRLWRARRAAVQAAADSGAIAMNETLRTRDCDKVLLVQAEFDGELDAAEAATLAAHRPLARSAKRRQLHCSAPALLMDDGSYEPTPDDVRRRVMARLAAAQPPPAAPLGAAVTDARLVERRYRLWAGRRLRCGPRVPLIVPPRAGRI